MRQASVPKNVVEALNEIFDKSPEALAQLLALKGEAPAGLTGGESVTVSVLDVVNTVLDKLAPGKRVAIIQGPDGLEGFTLARERKVTPNPVGHTAGS